MKRSLLAYLALLLGLATVQAKVNVVASNAIIADWAQAVGGNEVTVSTLAGPGTDPHHFSPSPKLVRSLAKTDLIIEFGAGMEPWLSELYTASGSRAKRLILTDGLNLMEPGEAYWNDIPALHPNAASEPPCCREDALAENEIWSAMAAMMPESHHDHHHEHCHDHGVDPHVWLDPQLALQMVLAINTALNEAAPEYTTYFNRRRETYLEALLEVDHWAKEQLALIPVERRILINHHDNLRYFGRRYGYFTPASILGSATTETADPSARQFTELIALIQAQDAPAIFIDATANPRLAEQLAREAGLPKPSILYTGNLTPADGPAPDYLSMMRANVGTITTALR